MSLAHPPFTITRAGYLVSKHSPPNCRFQLQGLPWPSPSSILIFLPRQSRAEAAGSGGCADLGAGEPPCRSVTNLQLQLLAESHSTSRKLKIAALTCFGKELLFKGLL